MHPPLVQELFDAFGGACSYFKARSGRLYEFQRLANLVGVRLDHEEGAPRLPAGDRWGQP